MKTPGIDLTEKKGGNCFSEERLLSDFIKTGNCGGLSEGIGLFPTARLAVKGRTAHFQNWTVRSCNRATRFRIAGISNRPGIYAVFASMRLYRWMFLVLTNKAMAVCDWAVEADSVV